MCLKSGCNTLYAWIYTRKLRELPWLSGWACKSKSLALLPAVLRKSWASIPGLLVCCSYFSSALAMKERSDNWMAKTVFQAFFLNEQKPEVTILVVFVWLFNGSVAWSEGMLAVRALTCSCPAPGPSSGTCCPALPCPQGRVAISQADPLFSLNLIHSPHVKPQRANAQESTIFSISWDLPNPLCQFKEKENMRKLSSFKWSIVK